MLKYRFKKFDNSNYSDWKSAKFDKVFGIIGNNTLSRDKLTYENGNVKNIHYGDILVTFGNITDINFKNVPYILNQRNKIDNSSLLNTGDIVIADTAEDYTVGKATEIYNPNNFPVTAGLHTIPCKPLFSFAQGYLGQFLNSPAYHNQLFQWMLGAKVYSVNKRDIVKTYIHYPSDLEEQQKIANFLSAVDNQIDIQRQRIEIMETQKKGLLDKVFSQELRFKRNDGSDYPDWEMNTLNYYCSLKDGDWIETKDQSSDGIRLIQTGNVGIGCFLNKGDKERFISESTFSRLHCSEIFYGDILISRLPKPAGRACIVPRLNCRMITAVDCTIVRPKNNVLPKYIVQYLNSGDYFKKITKSGITGTTRKRISRKELDITLIPMPCPEEQQKIANFFTAIDNQLDIEKQRLTTMETIKKGLLQQMFC